MRKLTTFVLMAILMLALASCGEGPEAIKFLDKKCPQDAASTGISPQAGAVDPNLKPDSYVAVVPQRLRRGYTEQISVSLFNGDRPASGNVRYPSSTVALRSKLSPPQWWGRLMSCSQCRALSALGTRWKCE